jgi:hypothetical protein
VEEEAAPSFFRVSSTLQGDDRFSETFVNLKKKLASSIYDSTYA